MSHVPYEWDMSPIDALEERKVQGGKDSWDALSLQVNFRKRAL